MLFFKKKPKEEVNQMNNQELKEKYANKALFMLSKNSAFDSTYIDSMRVEYGYIFTKTNGNDEALFKIIIEDKVYYFAVQKEQILSININERQYKETVDYMTGYHDCLKTAIKEKDIQKERRLFNNNYLTSLNISTNDNLFCRYDDDNVTLKSLDEICKRALASFFAIQIACDINNDKYKESLDFFVPVIKKFGLEDELNSKEKRIVDGTYSEQDVIDMDWEYETFWALLWSLGLIEDIKDASITCDCDKAMDLISSVKSLEDFKAKCQLRNIKEILDMEDLYYRYNWAINDKKVNEAAQIGNLSSSVVIERRRGLDWIIEPEKDWYNISLNA